MYINRFGLGFLRPQSPPHLVSQSLSRIGEFTWVESSRVMSDEEHHFESKADAGASKTYPQQAGTIRKSGYIVIKGRPCKVKFRFQSHYCDSLFSSSFHQFHFDFHSFLFQFIIIFRFWDVFFFFYDLPFEIYCK